MKWLNIVYNACGFWIQ